MRTIFQVVLMSSSLFLFAVGTIQAQQPDTTHSAETGKTVSKGQTRAKGKVFNQSAMGGKKGFQDHNGNGIDDRLEAKLNTRSAQRRADQFIDLDGDGICDGRESAIGLRKTARRQLRKGKKGK